MTILLIVYGEAIALGFTTAVEDSDKIARKNMPCTGVVTI